MTAKMIQKNPTKKATRTKSGAALFSDRKIVYSLLPTDKDITLVPSVILSNRKIRKQLSIRKM